MAIKLDYAEPKARATTQSIALEREHTLLQFSQQHLDPAQVEARGLMQQSLATPFSR